MGPCKLEKAHEKNRLAINARLRLMPMLITKQHSPNLVSGSFLKEVRISQLVDDVGWLVGCRNFINVEHLWKRMHWKIMLCLFDF